MHPNVHCSTIYSSQDTEVTSVIIKGGRIKNRWSIYTVEHYSAIKKNEIMPFAATWMGLEMSVTKQNKPDRKTNMISLICGI